MKFFMGLAASVALCAIVASPASAAYLFALSEDGTTNVTSFTINDPAEMVDNTDETAIYSVYTNFTDGSSIEVGRL